ncbi:MAG: aromatic ring-hydroxylating dioxygenase subunit alpha [Gammaproteobacteria bacterium]|nr:aromatic ring-hydroxylating dioxygenase subunit alpha [Gammaproteobacteria bacterium]
MFLKESWYVFGWERDLDQAGGILGRVIIGEPVVIWRTAGGELRAMADRCPHRHAPLSRGRVEGDSIRCMYHGMTLGSDGRCTGMPLLDEPPDAGVRVYPVVAKDSWLWVWMGNPENADESFIPDAFGIDDPAQPMRASSIEYQANFQLVHDNLCDLSHVDFVHSGTLRVASGAWWSQSAPRIHAQGRALRFERWFIDADYPGKPGEKVDTWISYDFVLPGIFILRGARYPAGTAAAFEGKEPVGIEPLVRNIEQQAVTPMTERTTAYHYATGLVGSTPEMTARLAERMDVVMAAFEEDRQMIEAQQKIWDLTPPETAMVFLPQDRGPFQMRRMLRKAIENQG